MFQFLRNALTPSFCASCRIFLDNESILCDQCRADIRPVVSRALSITKTKNMVVHAVGAYDQPLISLILAKSSGNRTVACQLGELIWQMSIISHLSFDYIVPIPLHWTRYAWRGYNQTEEIAKVLADKTEKPIVHLLKRVRRTSYQSKFKGQERLKNVAQVFSLRIADKESYRNARLFLIDDVMTSGATLKEAAKMLLTLRPLSITAMVVARAA